MWFNRMIDWILCTVLGISKRELWEGMQRASERQYRKRGVGADDYVSDFDKGQ